MGLTATMEKTIREVMREGVDRPTAVRMLIEIGHKKWKLQQSLRFLQEGKLSVWKAAEMSGMNLWDFLNVLRKENIPMGRVRPQRDVAINQPTPLICGKLGDLRLSLFCRDHILFHSETIKHMCTSVC